ncbi:four helix bundle protein [Candidatus Woesearchaeota archaeon]|nr:four helix bundle protein [Candidatus Woesearchaeota archaeon]
MNPDFKNLQVWHESQDFANQIYNVTSNFPSSEAFALTSQLRRAAVSISANIAEGSARSTMKDFRNFLYNARGSNKEVESHLHFASKVKYVSAEDYATLLEKSTIIGKMLTNLIKSVDEKI